MTEQNDSRTSRLPDEEPPEWFWTVVEKAQHRRRMLETLLAEMTDNELLSFQRILIDLAYSFKRPLFLPPEFGESDDWVDSNAQWVVSQGRHFFLRVRSKPDLFWKLLQDEEGYDVETSYEGIACRVWWERHQQDMPPV